MEIDKIETYFAAAIDRCNGEANIEMKNQLCG